MTKSMKNLKHNLQLVPNITFTINDDAKVLTITTYKNYNDSVWKLYRYNDIPMNYGWSVNVIRNDGKI